MPKRVVRIVYSPDPKAIGREIPLKDEAVQIGREVDGIGRIDDDMLSRAHARIYHGHANTHLLDDLQSRNGTFVDGERLDVPAVLSAGRVIALGSTLMVVDQEIAPDRLPAREDEDTPTLTEIVGMSLAMDRLRRSLAMVAQAPGHVLLRGPRGSGKEVAAKVIHRLSGRRGPLVERNCAAITEHLAESELFGHRKGAFTGAEVERAGDFVRASGGTLFLDEVGDLPAPIQAKLLRVLEDGVVRALGSDDSKKVDVRIVAATNRDLESSNFRGDLYDRLAGWTLLLPALAERRADILPLFTHFVPGARFHTYAAEALLLHPWPGNVRELRELAKRLDTMKGSRPEIDLDLLPAEMSARLKGRDQDFDESMTDEQMEADGNRPSKERLRQEMIRHRGVVSKLAEANNWHRTQVNRWLKRYGMDRHDFVRHTGRPEEE